MAVAEYLVPTGREDEFEDRLKDLIEDREPSIEIEMEINDVEGVKQLEAMDPWMAKVISILLESVCRRVKDVSAVLSEMPVEGLADQLKMLRMAEQLYEFTDDYYPLRISLNIYKIPELDGTVMRIIKIEWADDPDYFYVSVEGPEEAMDEVNRRMKGIGNPLI